MSLIAQAGLWRPASVVVRTSTFSNDFSSQAVRPKLLIFGIKHPQGNKTIVFCSDRIRTQVAMATYTSHRLIMEKVEIANLCFLIEVFEIYFYRNGY